MQWQRDIRRAFMLNQQIAQRRCSGPGGHLEQGIALTARQCRVDEGRIELLRTSYIQQRRNLIGQMIAQEGGGQVRRVEGRPKQRVVRGVQLRHRRSREVMSTPRLMPVRPPAQGAIRHQPHSHQAMCLHQPLTSLAGGFSP